MKKSVLLLAAAFGVTGAFAQDLTSKKGEPYLPEAGDWALSIEATPFLDYAGQMLSNSGASAPKFNFLSGDNLIMGKMFKDEKTAYRAGLRIGLNSEKGAMMVADRASTATNTFPTVAAMKENTYKLSETTFGLTGGLEMRRGKTRLQGYYGGEFGLFFQSSKEKYTYGNALSNSTTAPVDVDTDDGMNYGDWDNDPLTANTAANLTIDTYGNSARITESKGGALVAFGVRGFIGAEYFILPKISVGGEFGWGLGIASKGKSSYTAESWDSGVGSTNNVGTQTIEGGKGSMFWIDSDNTTNSFFGPSAALRLNLHF